MQINKLESAPNREVQDVLIKDLFGFGRDDQMISRFVEPGPLTPKIDPNYQFSKIDTIFGLMALSEQQNIYCVGHSGTGKTEWVKQVAARLNYNVVQINFDSHLLRSDLIGSYKLVGQETPFVYGRLVQGFQLPGTILLLDEVDACAPETAFVMQSALSEEKTLHLLETNESIPLHPQNCIMATANTTGQGDETGVYLAGTNVQNFSFLNRFKTTIKFDYLDLESEVKLLSGLYPDQPVDFVKGVCCVLRDVRAAFKAGNISRPLTTRDGINWMGKLVYTLMPIYSANYAFLNQMTERDAKAVAEFILGTFSAVEGDDPRFTGRAKTSV